MFAGDGRTTVPQPVYSPRPWSSFIAVAEALLIRSEGQGWVRSAWRLRRAIVKAVPSGLIAGKEAVDGKPIEHRGGRST